MPIHYLRRLTGHERDRQANRHLGYSLAFVAGAVNAGGFLAVGQYTSHMSGIVSTMADALALGEIGVVLTALASVLSFMSGAATTALLINWAHRRDLHSRYALSLLLEAFLLLLFGLAGAHLANIREFLAPATVILLCFIMGQQNAIITKISGAEIRTTHMTGMCTDIGIELGKLFYYNRQGSSLPDVRANRNKLKLHATLLLSFFIGAVSGGLGFKHVGYSATIPLAIWLTALAVVPVADDMRYRWRLFER